MLHLRWWHASAKKMRQLLQAAGVRDDVLALIPDIVDTCRACRMWKRPAAKAEATVRLVEEFNEVVQHDLLFHDSMSWQHLIDVCIRLAQAGILRSKDTSSIVMGIYNKWICPYGPMRILESDQEGGLVSEEAKVWLSRMGTTLKEKGVGAHVRMLERHHDILRQQFLKLKGFMRGGGPSRTGRGPLGGVGGRQECSFHSRQKHSDTGADWQTARCTA